MDGRQKPYTLLLGPCDAAIAAAVVDIAAKVGQTVELEPNVATALDRIESAEGRPLALLVSLEQRGAHALAVTVRGRFALAGLPIIGIASAIGDLTFEEAFANGFDDCCTWRSPAALTRRLRYLQDAEPVAVERGSETVVIADADRDQRLLIGRVFRDAGYQVAFALDPDDALKQSLDPRVKVVIVSAPIEAGGDAAPLSSRAPAAGSKAAWIINTPPKEFSAVRARLPATGDTKIALHDAFATPPTYLFVANELVSTIGKEVRKSERQLYGTTVRFRPAGRTGEDVGYNYNLSAGGTFVCTLAPPDRGEEMWIELIPPRTDRFVHLEATVVWARKYGPGRRATVPPGFGVQITGGSKTDLERYQQGYEAFLAERAARLSLRPALPDSRG